MILIAIQPVLAADAGIIIFIIIMALSGINWLMNNLGGNNQPQRPAGGVRPRREPNRGLQAEIDKFLAEVGGNKPQHQQKQRKTPQPKPASPRTQKPARMPVPAQERKRQRVQPQPEKPKPKRKSLETKHSKKPISWEMGDTVRSHVQQHLPSGHLDKIIQQDLGHQLEDSITTRFGKLDDALQLEGDQSHSGRSDTAQKLVNLLRDPEGVRQAILVNEVLSQPLAMRK